MLFFEKRHPFFMYISKNPIPQKAPFLFVILLLVMAACKSGYPEYDEINSGTNFSGRDGHPEIRLSAIGLFNEESEPGINVSLDIVYGSLIYKTINDLYISNVALELQVKNLTSNALVFSKMYELEVQNPEPGVTNTYESFNFAQRVLVSPGRYQVTCIVTDLSSQKESIQQSIVFIPDRNDERPNLTNIILLSKQAQDTTFQTVSSYHVSNEQDSLKFLFQVTNNVEGKRVNISSELQSFPTDTLSARPMSWNNLTRSSMQFKGIDYTRPESIQKTRRVITQGGSVLVEFVVPKLRRGNYRFSVSVADSSGEETLKARDFGVRSANYPSVKNVYELRDPLIYIMPEKEYKNLMTLKDPDSIKRAIDFFWLKNIERTNKAKNVLAMYYERVEQANKLFGNWKEGWKTDMGMVYILFGSPWYVDRNIDNMFWSYTYNRADPELNFVFDKILPGQPYFPFENYIFRRNRIYYQVEYNQIDVWLNGLVLQGR